MTTSVVKVYYIQTRNYVDIVKNKLYYFQRLQIGSVATSLPFQSFKMPLTPLDKSHFIME